MLTRSDFLEFMENSTTTNSAEGLDLGNYSYFVGRGKRTLKMFHKKEISCEFLSILYGIIDRLFNVVNNHEDFKKFAVSLGKG